jgi:hypothetical protein
MPSDSRLAVPAWAKPLYDLIDRGAEAILRGEQDRDRPLITAGNAVWAELVNQTLTITQTFPPDTAVTRTFIEHDLPKVVDHLHRAAAALEELGALSRECTDAVYTQRQPFIRFIERIESQGYRVDTETFTTVVDGLDWSPDDGDGSVAGVQLAAEGIARAEQAALHQRRLQRMNAAIQNVETQYAQRIYALRDRLCRHDLET